MDDIGTGRLCRALRRRLGWRQVDLGRQAGVSQQLISLLERGHLDRMPLGTVRAVFNSVDARVELAPRWRGGEQDRLLDERHALLVGNLIRLLQRLDWVCVPEVTYAHFGERGSIDLLAFHAPTRTLLVVEVKSELMSVEATVRKLDEKVRLAPRIAGELAGGTPAAIGRLLILPDHSTPRRHVTRHDSILSRAYPARGRAVRGWLRRPAGALSGILFLAPTNGGGALSGAVTRVRPKRAPSSTMRLASSQVGPE